MTIDETIADALGKSSIRSGIAARYVVRRNSQFFGYVEAHLDTHASTVPSDWVMTWKLSWQGDDGRVKEQLSDDLETLLQPFGKVDLATAMASVPGFGGTSRLVKG